ncbi:pyrrolidone-carboxylate peptidase [Deinococcus arenae]|uniref:Pyrrolidone-carboxylate peptidase n=1 Tax=Deinococcus arenae TaxID=1452751 RepID=A0A8H9L4T2_9DEIO|nr:MULTISPECIES: pyroglutamyl-peptidase I [Deinococcus]AWT35333.1 pyrrolidone-carboxylate peptidase [Deinococcus actinosclerus]GGM35646.1 pyrrolidone-carboxylate peptidase [Deinococcus arenae]
MPTLLLTGFEPFHTHPVNPSSVAAQALHGRTLGGHVIEGALLPVEPGAACERLSALLAQVQPDAVLLTGLASGRPQVTLERVAVNVMDYRIPDNAGRQYQDVPVVADAPAAYLSTLPLRATLRAWRDAGIPGGISDTAGTFVCNTVMFHALHALHAAGREDVPCGFLHLPANAEVALAEPKPVPYLPQEELTRAVEVAARAAIR